MSYPPDYVAYAQLSPTKNQVSYVYIPRSLSSVTIGGAHPFTLSVWVKLSTLTEAAIDIVKIGNGSSLFRFLQAQLLGGLPTILCTWGDTTLQYTPSPDAPSLIDHWCYITVTWDGTKTMSLCLNGAPLVSSTPRPDVINDPTFYIGSDTFIGGTRSFALWTLCLSSSQINSEQWEDTPIVTDGLVMYYDFALSPPKIIAGSTPLMNNTPLAMETSGLLSFGTSVAVPGSASTLNPSAAAPFSIIAWVAGGIVEPTGSERQAPSDTSSNAPVEGCLFSNGDMTDPGHMAIMFKDGVPTVQFGNEIISAPDVIIEENVWTCIAVTYDAKICTIYINGISVAFDAVTKTVTPSVKPILMGQVNNGVVENTFVGMLQFLSTWSVCLSAEEVKLWLDEDPSAEDSCVSNFSCSSNPPQDLVPLLETSIWSGNLIALGENMRWATTTKASVGSAAVPTPRHKRPARLRSGSATQPPVRRLPGGRNVQDSVPRFGEKHRAYMIGDFKNALSSIESEAVKDQWLREYEEQVNDIFARAETPGVMLPDLFTITAQGSRYALVRNDDGGQETLAHITAEAIEGGCRLTFYDLDGEILSSREVGMSVDCALWWTTFLYTLLTGLCLVNSWSTPTDRFLKIINDMLVDPYVMPVLATCTGKVFTTITVLALFKALYEYGYLKQALLAIMSKIGWWGATKLIAYIAGLCTPVPNPTQALFIAQAVVLTAQLILQLTHYSSKCGSGRRLASIQGSEGSGLGDCGCA